MATQRCFDINQCIEHMHHDLHQWLYYPTVNSAWQELLRHLRWENLPLRLKAFEDTFYSAVGYRLEEHKRSFPYYCDARDSLFQKIHEEQNIQALSQIKVSPTASASRSNDSSLRSINEQLRLDKVEEEIQWYFTKKTVYDAWLKLKSDLLAQQWGLVSTRLQKFEETFLAENKFPVNHSYFGRYYKARNKIKERIDEHKSVSVQGSYVQNSTPNILMKEHQGMSVHGPYVQNATPNLSVKSSPEEAAARSQPQNLDPYQVFNKDRNIPIQDKDSALKKNDPWGLREGFDNKDGSTTLHNSVSFSGEASSTPVDYSRDVAFMQKCIQWLGEAVQQDDSTAVQNKLTVESGVSEQALQTAEIIGKIHDKFLQTKRKKIEVLNEIETLRAEISKVNQGYQQLKYQQNESSRKHIDELQKEVRTLQQQLKAAEADKEYWMNRVSKVAGTKLTSNNPGITDLSDPNRPQKLAEKFGELYDNAWTDALEHLNQHTTSSETENIKILAQFLKNCYSYCHRLSNTHMSTLKKVLLNVSIDGGNNSGNREDVETPKALVDARKETVEYGMKAVEQIVMKASEKSFTRETKLIPEFLKSCIHICWGMVVQEPKLCFSWPEEGNNKTVNPDEFSLYTRSGIGVEYVVWPALLLHENGPTLRKGTYQPFANVKRK